ncbi:hypothetical protein BDQ17DRAFT_1428146 [Cyathus striatus]|nr:hypothetical protein BDQ17DRAFT_1428146 [Cyathus striatus]
MSKDRMPTIPENSSRSCAGVDAHESMIYPHSSPINITSQRRLARRRCFPPVPAGTTKRPARLTGDPACMTDAAEARHLRLGNLPLNSLLPKIPTQEAMFGILAQLE